ncbi:MAG: arsenate reductase [Sulfurimicrobium sp.]|jgi:Spx/MgsR family transcriptional regulator|nr:arsenate reductase [Sulfurimicrobium sp.]MDZ7656255.1 arsenate reductase [Sulfurimicrobium sp.]
MKLYGIPNCTTVKKARAWLENNGIAYEFHDFKKEGVNADQLRKWSKQTGWEKLLKKQGPTWGKLPPETKASANNETDVLALMEQMTNLIKRPILEHDGKVLSLGYDEKTYQILFNK